MGEALVPFRINLADLKAAFESLPGAIKASQQQSRLGEMVDHMHRRAVATVNADKRTDFNKNRLDRPREAMKYALASGISPLLVDELNACRNATCGYLEPTKLSLKDLRFPNLGNDQVRLPAGEQQFTFSEGQNAPTVNVIALQMARDAIDKSPVTGNICINCQGNNSQNPGCRFQKK